MEEAASVWVLTCGNGYSCGVFTSRELGEQAIKKYGLQGMLTQYPLDSLTYDWAIENNLWKPKKPHETEPSFIGSFSPRTPHYHYGQGGDAKSASPPQSDE
jgi:hypothetical protein